MKNIGIYFSYEPHSGGAYQFSLSVIEALVSKKDIYNYNIILFSQRDEYKYIAEEYGLKFELMCSEHIINRACNFLFRRLLPYKLYKRVCHIWYASYGVIIKNKIDIWITPWPDNFMRDLHLKSIIAIFDLMHRYEPKFEEVADEYAKREENYKRICQYADVILADSNVGKQHILQSYGNEFPKLEDKIRILPFIPASYVYEAKDTIPLKDIEFEKYVFYPAQFWEHKNHRNLIQAIALLKAKGITVNLVCVGSAKNAFENINELIKKNGLQEQVKILGYVDNDEIVALYQHARALVMPTFFGPTNIPPLEAFVLGCPVAISNIYGIPEQVGDAALLFDPSSVEEIANCIEQLWTDDALCESLKEKGKNRSLLWGRSQYAETLASYINEM